MKLRYLALATALTLATSCSHQAVKDNWQAPAGTFEQHNYNALPQIPQVNRSQALAALQLDEAIARFFEFKSQTLNAALKAESPFHLQLARNAQESLAMLQEQLAGEVPFDKLGIEHQIDYRLLQMQMAESASDLKFAIAEEQKLAQQLPASQLMLKLPVLTGLVDEQTKQAALNALTSAALSSQRMPTRFSQLSQARAAQARSRQIAEQLATWRDRANNRLSGDLTELNRFSKGLQKEFDAYADKLQKKIIPELKKKHHAFGEPAGAEKFVALLRERHLIEKPLNVLLRFGEEQLESIQKEIAQVSAKIDAQKSPAEVWRQLKQEHPSRETLPQFCYNEMQRAMALLLEKDAITIPANARENNMLLTEGFTYQTYPFGGYGGFELKGRQYIGSYLTSPPPKDEEEQATKQRLMGNNYYWARVVAVHEMYPGHHLQFVTAQLNARTMRRNFYTTTLGEGWGLYSEQMMYRLGFFDDDKTHLAMLKMRAWRAARVIIDIKLHTGQMSFDDAVAFLMQHVDMDEANATAEVRRYLGNPTRPMSYLYGYHQIEQLRKDYMAMKGDAFTDKDFHDRLLAYGPIPIPFIRAGMLGEPVPDYPLQ